MHLIDIVGRNASPSPWAEGEKIPWDEPGFSVRMLKEHLSQTHDAASRRLEVIDRQVAWIHRHVLQERPTRVLDLGCGPGLYTSRLARRGHTCTGIDFGPASIAYARTEAARDYLPCTYRLADVRDADFGEGYGLAMLIFGEMNVFRPPDIQRILRGAFDALAPGGWLLLEPQSAEQVERDAMAPSTWYSETSGLFSDAPSLVLTENFWDAESAAATIRFYVVDASTGEVTRHAQSVQAYSDEGFRNLLKECGFGEITFYPSLTGSEPNDDTGLLAILARRP
jgi:SAM-dependent methyltransferase